MIRHGFAFFCFALAVFLIGCGAPKPDDLVKQSIKHWEEAAVILEGISDEPSLHEASKKLDALAQRMVELNKRAAEKELSPDDQARLATENKKESQAALTRFNAAASKARTVPGATSVLLKFRRTATRTF